MNKTHGKIDELQAVDTVSQMRAIGTHADSERDSWMSGYNQGIEHGIKGGIITGQIKILAVMGELANEMQAEWPAQADAIRIVALQIYAALLPTGPRS